MARNLANDSIPRGWKYDFLDKFTERCSGHTPSQSFPEYWNGGVKWISLSDSYRLDKGYVYNTEKQISNEGLKHSSAVLLPAETVVLSRDAGIGKSGVMAEPMAVSQHFIAWKCDNVAKINSWFLYNWLQLHKKEFERQAVGSTIKTIGLPYFKKLKIAIPPYKEQKKIAKILSTWDKAIDTTGQLLANSQQQKKALMQQLVTGKKRFSGFTDKWKTSYLKELLSITKGEQRNKNTLKATGKYPVINGGVNPSGYTDKANCEGNTITISEGGNSCGYITYQPKDFWCGGHCYALSKYKLEISYTYHMLKHYETQIMRLRVGSGLPNIQKKDLEKLKVYYSCSISERNKIAYLLSVNDKEIKNLEKHLDCLRQEKKALMQQLLTGKRRVKTHSKEEASC